MDVFKLNFKSNTSIFLTHFCLCFNDYANKSPNNITLFVPF